MHDGCPPVVQPPHRDADHCFQQHDFGPFGWAPSKLAVRECVRRTKNHYFPKELRRLRAGKSFAKLREMRAAATLLDEIPDTAPMLAYYETWLRSAIDNARSTGARVVVLRQPWLQKQFTPEEEKLLWNWGKGRPHLGQVAQYFDIYLVHRLMAEVADVTERIALDMGVEACELRTRLEPSFEIFYDSVHNTPLGCEAVGKLVAEALLCPPAAARPDPDRVKDTTAPVRAGTRRAPGTEVSGSA
jgi:hypothetical protein